MFASTQSLDRIVIGAASQVEPTQPFDRNHASLEQLISCVVDWVLHRLRLTLGISPPQARPALRAGVGLGMKPSVHRIVIFALAGRAQREAVHRCVATVVRDLLNNGVSWTTVGAIDEGVTVTSIRGVEQFSQTIFASRQINRDLRIDSGTAVRKIDFELSCITRGDIGNVTLAYGGQCREAITPGAQKPVELPGRPFNLDGRPVGVVADRAYQTH